MGPVEDASARFRALVSMGEQIVRHPRIEGSGTNLVPSDLFYEWRTRSMNTMFAFLPPDHHAIHEFAKLTEYCARTSAQDGLGIVRGLALDAEEGILFTRITNLITAEVFDDFLEMAEHLLDAGHFHAAAGLIGAVLEDSLRKIADANGIPYTRRDGIDSLNQSLAKAGVYTAIVKRNVDVWKQVRNDSDHGHFDQVTLDDVRSMLRGVEGFLAQYLT